ncbi:MAG: putative ATPase [Aureispira sp.]|jgi:predicted ATPase
MISIYKDFDNPPKDLLGDHPKITKAVKQALYDLYHGKCAFTEEKLDFEEMVVAHYRPVSLYPALEFEWSNLLPVSPFINKTIGNIFPIQEEQVDSVLLENFENKKADSAYLLAEKPLLLHPEVDTPENHLTFSRYEELEGLTIKGNKTISYLGLNFSDYTEDHNIRSVKLAIRKIRTKILEKLKKIIRELKDTLKNNYNSLDFNFSEGQIKHISGFLPKKYTLLLEPFFNKLHQFTEKDQPFSYASYSFIRGQLGIYNNKAGSTREEASLNNVIGQVIKIGYQFFVSKPHYIEKSWTKSTFPSIAKLHIQHFHSIKNLQLPTVPINSKWIFLTGENGAGKSLILQAIALSFLNQRFDFVGLTDNTRIELEIHTIQNPLKIILDNERRSHDTTIFQKFAAYGPSRLDLKESYLNRRKNKFSDKLSSIFQKSERLELENIDNYLAQVFLQEKDLFKQIKNVLLKLLPTIDDIEVAKDSVNKELYTGELVYKQLAGNLSSVFSFQELSSGNKSIIAMIGDMIIQLLETQQVDEISDLEGIVLIDEIDIHLHPNWQKKFVQTLTKLFPKIQFIASTHSPIPLLGAPKETVILNVEKPSSREGIKVRKLDIDVTTLTPNTILTSPIFGFEGIISDAHQPDEPLYTGDTYNDVVFEQHLDRKLKQIAEDGNFDLEALLKEDEDDQNN